MSRGLGDVYKRQIINLDFADVKTIMKQAGTAMMGIGTSSGDTRAVDAAQQAISSPLLESSIYGATRVLLSIAGSKDLGIQEISDAADVVANAVDPEANIIFGAAFDDTLEDELRVTVIATGFDEKEEAAAAPAADMSQKPFSQAGDRVKESQQAAPQGEASAAPVVEPEKAAVSDDDWDILERIFSRKR